MDDIRKGDNKFYIGDDSENPMAVITFIPSGEDKIIIDHTYVSEQLRGQGIGERLVKRVVDYARQENKKIIPVCSFVKDLMTGNDEYRDVL